MNKIKIPFYLKLSIIISLLIIFIVLGISYILLSEIKEEYYKQVQATSNLVANLVIKYSVEPIVMENYSSLYNILNNLKNDKAANITQIAILDPSGTIKVSTNHLDEGKQIKDINNIQGEKFIFGNDYLDVIAPIMAYDHFWGFLKFRYSLSGYNKVILTTRYQILYLAIIFILIGLFISFLVAKAIVKPINELVTRAKEISNGNFNNPIMVKSRDEFGFLANTLEEMRISLKYFVSKVAKRAISYDGNLDILSLPTVLRLLNATKHTGGLVLRQKNQIGVIYFSDGEIIDASLNNLSGQKAFIAFFNWESGDFKFSPKLYAEHRRIEKPFDELLLNAVRHVHNQKIFKQILPSDEIVISPAVADDYKLVNKIYLNKDEEKLLQFVHKQIKITELRHKLNWPQEKINEILYRLISIGLITNQKEDSLELSERKTSKNIIPFPQKSISNK